MKRSYLILTVILMVLIGLQLGSVAAAKPKLIDKGSHSYYSNITKSNSKVTWKAYQYNRNYILVKVKWYDKGVFSQVDYNYLKKSSSKIIKIKCISHTRISKTGEYIDRHSWKYKYKGSLKKFYFKLYKRCFYNITEETNTTS